MSDVELQRDFKPLSALPPDIHQETEWQFDAADLEPLRVLLSSCPQLAGLRVVPGAARDLTDCYLDTPDARLARVGYALRLRSDGQRDEATLKSLHRDSTGPVMRREISQPLAPGGLAGLLSANGPVAERARAVVGQEPLQPLFTVQTHRDVYRALHGDIDAAEIVLDVTRLSADGRAETTALRRVEVELHDAPLELVQPLVDELCRSNALEPAKLSKYVAGLNAAGRSLPMPPAPSTGLVIDTTTSAITVGQQLLRQQLQHWRELEPAVRFGVDPEALHRLRITGRRMIAVLRLLERAPLPGARRLRERLQALLRLTGAARDLDVQCSELVVVAASLQDGHLQPLLERLHRKRHQVQRTLLRHLDAKRTLQLFATLDRLCTFPAGRRRQRPVAAVAEEVIRRRFRRVRTAAGAAAGSATLEQLHELRLEAKKLRYVAEYFGTLYGEPLQRFLRRLQRLQSLLGRVNDARHAIASFEAQIGQRQRLPASVLFVMGRLAEKQQHRITAARGEIDQAWKRASGKCWRRLKRSMRARVRELESIDRPSP